MDDLFDAIENAEYRELNQILDAAVWRYRCLFPDWDITFLSLPKDSEERKKQLEQMLEQLRSGQIL